MSTIRRRCAVLLFLFWAGAGAVQAGLSEQRFLWNAANARMMNARTQADYRMAAAAYRRVAEEGVRNGPLFYNLGTACLKAGDYDEAARCLFRAERYMGTDPSIERNLLLAMGRGKRDPMSALPWYRPLLFWHYAIPGATRVAIAAVAFSLCWFALILPKFGAPALGRQLLVLALIALTLFGTSAAASLLQEHRDDSDVRRFESGAEAPGGGEPGAGRERRAQ